MEIWTAIPSVHWLNLFTEYLLKKQQLDIAANHIHAPAPPS